MKILVAPNSMKGTLNASEFADAIEEGLNKAGKKNIVKLPVADGGDGTAKILANAFNGAFIKCKVKDPFFRDINSGFYLTDKNVAFIEMADASGLKLLHPSEYAALKATSYGTGQLIRDAVKSGARTILLGVGGSASVDGGMGALLALGVKMYSASQKIEIACGETMGDVLNMDIKESVEMLKDIEIVILSDVKNPLLGKNGASYIYAPQKGASNEDVKKLERNMALFCGVLFQTTGKDVSKTESGGAAGGISAAFNAVFNAEIVNGAYYILKSLGFYEEAKTADIVITGEGKIDFTSLEGKASEAILNYGMKIDVPVYAICGVNNLINSYPYKGILSLSDLCSSESKIIKETYQWVIKAAEILGKKL